MRRLSWSLVFACCLFVLAGPLCVDLYNTLNQRAFADLLQHGDPFALANQTTLHFREFRWKLDWPYPPITLLFVLPAWSLYRIVGSEPLYQFVWKLPFLLSAVATQWLTTRARSMEGERAPSHLAHAYLLNPAVVLLAIVAGGYDIVAALLIPGAAVLFLRRRLYLSGLALGLAGALRLYPLILLPLYVHLLWRAKARPAAVFTFVFMCIAPLIVSFLPLIAGGDIAAFITGQRSFGPFATVNFVTPFAQRLFSFLGYTLSFQQAGNGFVICTVIAIVGAYGWLLRRRTWREERQLVDGSLLLLLVFFLCYPKVHGLYTVAFLPLAIMGGRRWASMVWVPGLIWMLTVNGHFGARGLFYWLAPTTGLWISPLPDALAQSFGTLLAGIQAVLLVAAIGEVVRSGD